MKYSYVDLQSKSQLIVALIILPKEYSVRREELSQALDCSCTSELNIWAFTINLIVNAPVFSSDVQLQFSALLSYYLLTEYSLG